MTHFSWPVDGSIVGFYLLVTMVAGVMVRRYVGKVEHFLVAGRDVARARGMAQLARDTGLGRESLYKALAPGAKPRYDTVLKVLHALGVKLHVELVQAQ